MVANTYATMQARIADELDRADLTSQIQNAIQDSIGVWERRYFYFNAGPLQFSFNTVRTQEYYTAADQAQIPTSPHIQTLTGTFYGWRRQLWKRDWATIDSYSWLATSYAQPEDWAYAGEQIRLYPIPDNTYLIECYAVSRLARPANPTDAGPWMNDAEALVRTTAKIRLITEVIRGTDMTDEIALLRQQEMTEYGALTGENTDREAVGHVEPSTF